MMKRLIPFWLWWVPLVGVGQTWYPLSCNEMPIIGIHCDHGSIAADLNPQEHPYLFQQDTTGLWQYGASGKPFFNDTDPMYGWITDSVNSYGIGGNSHFVVAAPNSYDMISWLSFEHKYDMESPNDRGHVQFSCDRENWYSFSATGNNPPAPPEFIFTDNYGVDGSDYFTATTNEWQTTSMAITWSIPLVHQPEQRALGCESFNLDTVYYRFVFERDTVESNQNGWMIRKLTVGHYNISGMSSIVDQPLQIFPNPTTFTLRIQLPDGNLRATQTRLYDMNGRLVLQQPYNPVVDVSALDTGSYILVVETEQGRFRNVIQKE
jgi:hypothetical protein